MRFRYRVNAAGIRCRSSKRGIAITLRSIKPDPVPLEVLKVEQEIIDNFFPRQGLVLVVGETGSGKSTLLSSMIRHSLEQPGPGKTYLTYEAPIEYIYDNVQIGNNVIQQSEVGSNVESFASGVRNALRRSPEIILIGEARDRETIEACVRAANTGHLVFATVHANSVAETMRRMAGEFPPDIQEARMREIISSLRMCVAQYLARRPEGGRIALREYLVFTNEVRDQLLDAPIEKLIPLTNKMVGDYGQTMASDAEAKHRAGAISSEVYKTVIAGI